LVYAEFSIGYARIEEIDKVLAEASVQLVETPRPALFLAGKAFQRYRAKGGARRSVLPVFFMGAHALVARFVVADARCALLHGLFSQPRTHCARRDGAVTARAERLAAISAVSFRVSLIAPRSRSGPAIGVGGSVKGG
jgi:hypothetical protein